MRRPAHLALALSFALTLTAAPVRLKLDTSEADQVLAILETQDITEADWQRLFETEPYVRLKKREAAMNRAFTDEEFRAFVLSPEVAKQREALRRTPSHALRLEIFVTLLLIIAAVDLKLA